MELANEIAKQVRDFYRGENYTGVNLHQALAGITWQEATTKLQSHNTIAALVYHIHYYVHAVHEVLQGRALTAHDKYSFDVPFITSEKEWKEFLEEVWSEGEAFAKQIEQLPDNKFIETFVDERYGSYYRNIQGSIEHANYHLGQISFIKKLLRPSAP